jgi:hypothetical protein
MAGNAKPSANAQMILNRCIMVLSSDQRVHRHAKNPSAQALAASRLVQQAARWDRWQVTDWIAL